MADVNGSSGRTLASQGPAGLNYLVLGSYNSHQAVCVKEKGHLST